MSRGTADNNYNDEDVDEDGDNGHDGDDMKNIAMMMMMMGWPTSACCRWQNSESEDDVQDGDYAEARAEESEWRLSSSLTYLQRQLSICAVWNKRCIAS